MGKDDKGGVWWDSCDYERKGDSHVFTVALKEFDLLSFSDPVKDTGIINAKKK